MAASLWIVACVAGRPAGQDEEMRRDRSRDRADSGPGLAYRTVISRSTHGVDDFWPESSPRTAVFALRSGLARVPGRVLNLQGVEREAPLTTRVRQAIEALLGQPPAWTRRNATLRRSGSMTYAACAPTGYAKRQLDHAAFRIFQSSCRTASRSRQAARSCAMALRRRVRADGAADRVRLGRPRSAWAGGTGRPHDSRQFSRHHAGDRCSDHRRDVRLRLVVPRLQRARPLSG